MLGISPIRIAIPCTLEETASPIITGTGDTPAFRVRRRAIGATINTVTTLSTNIDINDAKQITSINATARFFELLINLSDIVSGIRE